MRRGGLFLAQVLRLLRLGLLGLLLVLYVIRLLVVVYVGSRPFYM